MKNAPPELLGESFANREWRSCGFQATRWPVLGQSGILQLGDSILVRRIRTAGSGGDCRGVEQPSRSPPMVGMAHAKAVVAPGRLEEASSLAPEAANAEGEENEAVLFPTVTIATPDRRRRMAERGLANGHGRTSFWMVEQLLWLW